MTIHNVWRPAAEDEERIDFPSGAAIVLFRDHAHPRDGIFYWRIPGWNHPLMSTYTCDPLEARKLAMRGADLLVRRFIEENAAGLIMVGTGMTK